MNTQSHDYTLSVPRRLLAGLLILLMSLPMAMSAGETPEAEKVNYVPQIHGAMRVRYEMDTDNDASRFQVRNVRVTLGGKVAPSIDYFVQTDLCDRGKMKILDAWGRIGIVEGLAFQAGQFRLPFGTDCFRGPADYIFANRSFIGKQMCNVRGVGAKLSYTVPLTATQRMTVEGGAFNPTSIADHEVWVKRLSYAGKLSYTIDRVKVATGVQSLVPDIVRTNLWGASVTWNPGRLTLEVEYMHKHYTHRALRASQGWVMWADYAFPLKAGAFNRASLQARWDGMTAHSDGACDDNGTLSVTHQARNRVTAGATLTYAYKAVRCDLRLDYEKYFYHKGAAVAPGDGDKICAEMVIRF